MALLVSLHYSCSAQMQLKREVIFILEPTNFQILYSHVEDNPRRTQDTITVKFLTCAILETGAYSIRAHTIALDDQNLTRADSYNKENNQT